MTHFGAHDPPRPLVVRPSDVAPLTDAAEVAAARRVDAIRFSFGGPHIGRPIVVFPTAPGADPDWLSEAEAYGTHEANLAGREARDRGDYDDDPFREL